MGCVGALTLLGLMIRGSRAFRHVNWPGLAVTHDEFYNSVSW